MLLENRIAVVTGGARGIGAATASLFRSEGARVEVWDSGGEHPAAGDDEGIVCRAVDVSDTGSVEAALEELISRAGVPDILVNNAGIISDGFASELSDEDWARVLDINVTGMARVSAAALPHLRASQSAAIVNLCSIGALNGLPQRALYNASKGAVLSLTYAMATDHVREGVRVNAVSPGTVATPFVDNFLKQFDDPVKERAALDARQATGRMVTPEEVAGAVLYLASPLSGSTTGTALEVDGGVTHLRVRQQ